MIRFTKHFVEDTETKNKAKIRYSLDGHIFGKPCVTLYAQEYGYDLDKIFEGTENNTDSQVDYFQKSRVGFFEESEYYIEARRAAIASQEAWNEHLNKIQSKRNRNNLKIA